MIPFKPRARYLLTREGLQMIAARFLTGMGGFWLVLEILNFFFSPNDLTQMPVLLVCVLGSGLWAITAALPRTAHSRHFASRNTKITLTVGNLLGLKSNIAVLSSDYFDTCSKTIAARSVIGQVVNLYSGGDTSGLDRAIERSLTMRGALGTTTTKAVGKTSQYPPGTTAVLPHDGRQVYLVVGSRMLPDTTTVSDADSLWQSLQGLWDAVRETGNLASLSIPVWGAGLARAPGSRTALFQMMMASFALASSQGPITEELKIVIWHKDYRPDEFEAMCAIIDGLSM